MISTVALFTILASLVAATPIQQIAQNGQCLQVSGTPAGGSPVTLGDCNSSNAQSAQSTGQQWAITAGNNAGVQLYGTTLCLDAQANPETGRAMVVYPCIANAPQTWYLTDDNRIAITGGTQCLNVDGTTAQTTPCAPGINTQAFTNTLLFDTETATSVVSSQPLGTGGVVVGASSLAASATSGAAAIASSAAQSASASASAAASSVQASASSVASSAAMSASNAVSSASGAASSAVASASSGASSVLGSASSGASSVLSTASAGASSVASDITSGAGAAASTITSGAGGVASSLTSGAGGVLSSVTSAAGAATSAVVGAAVSNTQVSLAKVGVALGGVALGAILVL